MDFSQGLFSEALPETVTLLNEGQLVCTHWSVTGSCDEFNFASEITVPVDLLWQFLFYVLFFILSYKILKFFTSPVLS